MDNDRINLIVDVFNPNTRPQLNFRHYFAISLFFDIILKSFDGDDKVFGKRTNSMSLYGLNIVTSTRYRF